MTAQAIVNTRSARAEFNTLSVALSYIDRSTQPAKYTVVLGDNNLFWVLTNRFASILVKAGYQYA